MTELQLWCLSSNNIQNNTRTIHELSMYVCKIERECIDGQTNYVQSPSNKTNRSLLKANELRLFLEDGRWNVKNMMITMDDACNDNEWILVSPDYLIMWWVSKNL